MVDDTIVVELTQRQVEILLEYTYPFENEEEQLKSFSGKPGTHLLKSDDFYLPRLIGDLVYSAKKVNDDDLLEEFSEICVIMDFALSRKTGTSTTFV